MRVTYNGTASPVGLASVFYQPAISNWRGTDAVLPFVTQGSYLTNPLGDVPDSPGLYGRVAPFGWRPTSNGPYTLYNNNVSGVNYLRIAQAGTTSWVGGAGNTTGGRGVNAGQADPFVRNGSSPPYPYQFNSSLTDLVVLKLGITLGPDTDVRTLLVGTAEAFAGAAPTLDTQVKWFSTLDDLLPGSIRGGAQVVNATINVVPSAPGAAVFGCALALYGRGRRRRVL